MTLDDLVSNAADLTDEALVRKFKSDLKEIEKIADDPTSLREALSSGVMDGFIEMEAEDCFGSEWMQL